MCVSTPIYSFFLDILFLSLTQLPKTKMETSLSPSKSPPKSVLFSSLTQLSKFLNFTELKKEKKRKKNQKSMHATISFHRFSFLTQNSNITNEKKKLFRILIRKKSSSSSKKSKQSSSSSSKRNKKSSRKQRTVSSSSTTRSSSVSTSEFYDSPYLNPKNIKIIKKSHRIVREKKGFIRKNLMFVNFLENCMFFCFVFL